MISYLSKLIQKIRNHLERHREKRKRKWNSVPVEEPPHKKKKICPPSSLSKLPDELVLSCLARTSIWDHGALSLVSKSFNSLIASPELYNMRSLFGCTAYNLYICLHISPEPTPRWFILKNRMNYRLALRRIPSLPSQPTEGSSVAVLDWGIYVIGGLRKGRRLSTVLFLDCRTHTWRELPLMGVSRCSPAVGVVDGKIYVFGGCLDYDSPNWAEVFDPKTQTWEACKWGKREPQGYRRGWCVVGKYVYCFDKHGNLYWSELEAMHWRIVQGLGSLQTSLQSSKLVHFEWRFEDMWEEPKAVVPELYPRARLTNSGGPNILLFWDLIKRDRLEMWCAEVSMEACQGPEIWGKIEWSHNVMTIGRCKRHYKLLHSVFVTL